MALYDYQCQSCSTIFEVRHPMNDTPIVPCPQCRNVANKIFSKPSIKFIGEGFYVNDYSGKPLT